MTSKADPTDLARLRLRYDILARDSPELMDRTPPRWTRWLLGADEDKGNPEDGITLEMDAKKGRKHGPPLMPGGEIDGRSRMFSRQCVMVRATFSVVQMQTQREIDLGTVRAWIASENFDVGETARIEQYFGVHRAIEYIECPPGYRLASKVRPGNDNNNNNESDHSDSSESEGQGTAEPTATSRRTMRRTEDTEVETKREPIDRKTLMRSESLVGPKTRSARKRTQPDHEGVASTSGNSRRVRRK